MTYEEAIRQAENRLTHIRMMRDYYRCAPSIITNTIDFLKVSKEALEKQIAKKPWSQADDDTCLYYHNECPYCGKWLSERIKPHHCECGQAIDWSDDE